MDKIQDITKMKQYVLSIISDNYNEGCGVMVGDNVYNSRSCDI